MGMANGPRSQRALMFTMNNIIVGCLLEIGRSSGARQSVDGGDCSIDDESDQLEPVLEQLATHVPDLIVFRSHDAPLPQTIHSYGVIMFGDISGKHFRITNLHTKVTVDIIALSQDLRLYARGTVVGQRLRVMVRIS